MMGVTAPAPTGDQGSNCGVNDIRAHVEYPASDPGVPGVRWNLHR